MTDYFSLFDLPRRPLLDSGKLNDGFARRNAGNQAAKRGEAVVPQRSVRFLSGTVSRLEHLLVLESVSLGGRVISPEWSNGWKVALSSASIR